MLAFSSYSYSDSTEVLLKLPEMGKSVIPVIEEITTSYEFSSLEKHMARSYLEGNEENYKKMLSEASVLGKMQSCSNIEFGKSEEYKGLWVLQGECPFKNGNGGIQMLLQPVGSELSLVYLIIKPL